MEDLRMSRMDKRKINETKQIILESNEFAEDLDDQAENILQHSDFVDPLWYLHPSDEDNENILNNEWSRSLRKRNRHARDKFSSMV